jgi:uncharacterized delta-60 repeat protein
VTHASQHRRSLPLPLRRATLVPLAVLFLARPLAADDGALDPTFDGDGTVVLDVAAGNELAHAVAVQPDGKVLVAGKADVPGPTAGNTAFAVVRLNVDGSRDASFGTNGATLIDFDLGAPLLTHDEATAVAVQPDGRVVLCGAAQLDFSQRRIALTRLLPTGQLDLSFGGGDGRQDFPAGPNGGGASTSCSLLVRRNGKILVTAANATGDDALLQLESDGDPDTTFGNGGRSEAWTCAMQGCGNFLTSVELPDGALLSLGTTGDRLVLARFLGTGGNAIFDVTFGEGGVAAFTPPGDPWFLAAAGIALDHHGNVLVMAAETGWMPRTALLRLRGDQADGTYGSGGWNVFPLVEGVEGFGGATAMALQPDDKPILVGTWGEGGDGDNWQVLAMRRTASGDLDATFSGGWRKFPFDAEPLAEATAVALSGGRVVVAGFTDDGTGAVEQMGAARLDGALLWSDGFESGSTWSWAATQP